MENTEEKKHILSPREVEVANMICYELTFKEIGAQLGLSTTTIITHVLRIRKKLGVSNVAGMVRVIVLNGWLNDQGESIPDTPSLMHAAKHRA